MTALGHVMVLVSVMWLVGCVLMAWWMWTAIADDEGPVVWCAECDDAVTSIADHVRRVHGRNTVMCVTCDPHRMVDVDLWDHHRSLFHQARAIGVEDLAGWSR